MLLAIAFTLNRSRSTKAYRCLAYAYEAMLDVTLACYSSCEPPTGLQLWIGNVSTNPTYRKV